MTYEANVPPMEHPLTFANQKVQYPPADSKEAVPGISYFKGEINDEEWVDCLLMRDDSGELTGILNYYAKDFFPWEQAGNFTIFVDPAHYREGIATRLIREADKRWNLNFDQQGWTPMGAAMMNGIASKILRSADG